MLAISQGKKLLAARTCRKHFWRFFSCPNGSAENIFQGFLAVRTDLPKTFLKVFWSSGRLYRPQFVALSFARGGSNGCSKKQAQREASPRACTYAYLIRPRYSKRTENFKRPKNREDSSDLDENLTESIAAMRSIISEIFGAARLQKNCFQIFFHASCCLNELDMFYVRYVFATAITSFARSPGLYIAR